MFEVKSNMSDSHFFISDGNSKYLHCDGRILSVCEYFESREDAQAVLDKFYPKPKHIWKHGDVFTNGWSTFMYLHPEKRYGVREPQVVYVDCDTHAYSKAEAYLKDAKFLFNIKEKINV